MADDLVAAVRGSAERLGVDPSDILTVMSYETGGRLDPNLWGGKNKNYLGLIQFGPEERVKYGVKPGQNATEQVLAAENFLRDRGVKPGMGLLDIYSTVNAGRPGLYNRSDAANGGAPGTVADKVASMAGHRMRANALLGIQGGQGVAVAPGQPGGGPAAGAVPLSLTPSGDGDGESDLAKAFAGLSAISQQQDTAPAAPQPMKIPSWAPPVQYASPPGLAKARALARAMSRTTLG